MIRDNKGKEYDVDIVIFKGTAIVARVMPLDIPVASVIITDEGEMRSAIRNQDFRDSSDLTNAFLEAERYALRNKIIAPLQGGLFGVIHPEHGSNKLMPLMGCELSHIMINGTLFNKWFVPTEKILNGVIH